MGGKKSKEKLSRNYDRKQMADFRDEAWSNYRGKIYLLSINQFSLTHLNLVKPVLSG